MHLLYIDDSGTVKDRHQKHFVLAGFSIFETETYMLSRRIEEIMEKFKLPTDAELHGSPMVTGSGVWRSIPKQTRIDCIHECLCSLTDARFRVFAAVVDKEKYYTKNPVITAFEQVSSRFDQYLMRQFRKDKKPYRGLMICDKATSEETLQAVTHTYIEKGHSWGALRNFAEVPLFLDSKASRMIQLADLIAYGVFQKYERGNDMFFKDIEPRFDRDIGNVYGLKELL